ncbi:MAG: alpha/beta hydrolase, partial [Burkholderiales bacterium]
MERRDFLQHIGALGAAAALPAAFPTSALAKPYDPAAKFDLKVSDVHFRKNAAGRQLWARIYQPQASEKNARTNAGPFPMVLDLHGGAWTRKDRYAEEPMDRAIAWSGVVVVAIDMTLSGEAPYPA